LKYNDIDKTNKQDQTLTVEVVTLPSLLFIKLTHHILKPNILIFQFSHLL